MAKPSQAVRSARALVSGPVDPVLLCQVAYERALDEWETFANLLASKIDHGEELTNEEVFRLTELRLIAIQRAKELGES